MQSQSEFEVSFQSSRFKTGFMLIICIIFVLAGIFLLDGEEKWVSWLCIGLFGFMGIPVFLWQLFRPGRLYLSQQGFRQVMMGRTLEASWDEVSEFIVLHIKGNKFVGFSLQRDEGKKMAAISGALTGGTTGMLGDTFGMPADELAELMNKFRNDAILQNSI